MEKAVVNMAESNDRFTENGVGEGASAPQANAKPESPATSGGVQQAAPLPGYEQTYQQPQAGAQSGFQSQQTAQSQTQPKQQPYSQAASQIAPPTSGLAVAGLVLGIVGLVLVFFPVLNFASPFIGLIGLILAIAARSGIKKGAAKGNGLAVAGIVLNFVTIVLALMITVACSAVLDSASSGSSSAAAKPSSASAQVSSAASESAPAAESEESADDDADTTKGASDKFAVSIDSAKLVDDYDGEPAVVVTYTWENNSDDTASFLVQLDARCYQDGVQLDPAFVTEGMDEDDTLTNVKPGYSATVQMAYSLKNTESPVEVEVSEMFDFNKTVIASATFDME